MRTLNEIRAGGVSAMTDDELDLICDIAERWLATAPLAEVVAVCTKAPHAAPGAPNAPTTPREPSNPPDSSEGPL